MNLDSIVVFRPPHSNISIIVLETQTVREKYLDDILQFMAYGYSSHDCYEINGELSQRLGKLGFKAKVVRLHPDVKHYVVVVQMPEGEIVVDAVPELSGLFSNVLKNGFIGTWDEAMQFYGLE